MGVLVMTKKDYILISDSIRKCKSVKEVIWELAKSLSIDNNKFDTDKFLSACDASNTIK